MKRIHVDDPQVVELITGILRRDGVAIIPTDTLYGLSTPLSSRTGHERILAMKAHGEGHRFVYVAESVEMVERHIESWGCTSKERMRRLWPAPLTAVFAAGKSCPEWIGETIALRVPDMLLLRFIVGALGEPILSTSVNPAGEPPLRNPKEMEDLFGATVDIMITGDAEMPGTASTIVDFTGAKPELIRRGDFPWSEG